MFITNGSESVGEVPGLQSVATAMATSCFRKRSTGGGVAMEIVRRAPERVLRLALVATSPLADTPAEAAGLREGDIVVAVDGEPVESMTDLAGIIRDYDPDEEITLTVLRGDEELEIDLVLGTRPANPLG